MAKVYVSSTISDLEAERQAVMEWLVAAQHQVVHSYRPGSDTVRGSCLQDVDTPEYPDHPEQPRLLDLPGRGWAWGGVDPAATGPSPRHWA